MVAFDRRLSTSVLIVASFDMTLPRYVKCSTGLSFVLSMVIRGSFRIDQVEVGTLPQFF